MKIIKCYIENYGCISETEINFKENITSFCADNGTGKTTLASFIKAMFYGLDSYTVSSVNFVDRKHFYPFSGGNFGGNLTFEYKGKIYKIIRFFKEKSSKDDTFELYCNDELSNDFSSEIGKEIFGIDKESFERLMFISSDDIDIESNASINLKLNQLLDGQIDVDLDSVIKKLEDKYKKVKSSKTSEFNTTKASIKDLNTKIINLEKIEEELDLKYDKKTSLQQQIAQLEEKESRVIKSDTFKANLEYYQKLEAEILEKNKQKEGILNKYNNKVLNVNDIKELSSLFAKKKILNEKIENTSFTVEEQYALDQLIKVYSIDGISEEKLTEIKEKSKEFSSLKYEINSLEDIKIEEKERKIKSQFSQFIPNDNEIVQLDNTLKEINELTEQYNKEPDFIEEKAISSENKHSTSKLYLLFMVVGISLMALSIPMFIINQIIPAIAMIAIGFLVLLIDAFIYLKNKSNSTSINEIVVSKENSTKKILLSKLESKKEFIRNYLIRFGVVVTKSLEYEIEKFKEDYTSYLSIIEKEKSFKEKLTDLKNKFDSIDTFLKEFYGKYGIFKDDYDISYTTLITSLERLAILKDKKLKCEESLINIKDELERVENKIKEICDKYGFDLTTVEPLISDMLVDIYKYDSLLKEISDKEKEAKEFKDEKLSCVDIELSEESIDDIRSILSEKRKEYASLSQQISDDESTISLLDDYRNERSVLKEKLDDISIKSHIIDQTIISIKTAEKKLVDKYVEPVKNKFIHYSKLLEDTLGDRLVMDKNFKIYYERNGINRSEKHLSSGLRSICMLCFRLALLDNMYKGEKPIIIMDDPLVNLDEKHLDKAKNVIMQLSSEMQIIYFTCHKSRDL